MSTIPGLPLSGSVRVLIAAKPVDFRKGADGLAALAKEVLAQDPFSGAIIVFRAKRADRVCKRRSKNPSMKQPSWSVAPE